MNGKQMGGNQLRYVRASVAALHATKALREHTKFCSEQSIRLSTLEANMLVDKKIASTDLSEEEIQEAELVIASRIRELGLQG